MKLGISAIHLSALLILETGGQNTWEDEKIRMIPRKRVTC